MTGIAIWVPGTEPGGSVNQAPTVPTGLTVSSITETSAQLDWAASTDDVGVAGYEYRIDGGTAVDVGVVLTANVSGLTASTAYTAEVRAYDGSSAYSAWSSAESFTTSASSSAVTSDFDTFVTNADGEWYDFDAATTTITDGYVPQSTMEAEFNASSGFIGLQYQGSRFKFESAVPEMGNIPALLLFSPPGTNGANFIERVSIPKDKDVDFTPGREVAVEMSYFFIDPPGGNSDKNATGDDTIDTPVDIRTYSLEPHVKRNGISTFGNQPGDGTNPGADGAGAEFVLLSGYPLDSFSNNFPYGDKGDQYGLERPEGFTAFDVNGVHEPAFSLTSSAHLNDRQVVAVGLYAHDVTDYNYQSQIYPCYPNTNIRLTVPKDELIENKFLIGLNTVTGGVSNSDGYFKWYMRVPSINGGAWFLAATLTNRDFTGDVAMNFGNLSIGEYHGGNGAGYYLNSGATGNGLWFTKMAVSYQL